MLAICAGAAAALQISAWQIARTVIGRERPTAATAAPLVTPVQLATSPTQPGPATALLPAAAPAALRAVAPGPVTIARAVPPSRRPAAAALGAGKATADDDNGDAASRRPFYEFREVDVPAEPVDEWRIDSAALDALATSRIVFTLFVAGDGSILYCRVDEPEHLSAEARLALAARLAETSMRPARRGGVAVASRRRVELFTEGGV